MPPLPTHCPDCHWNSEYQDENLPHYPVCWPWTSLVRPEPQTAFEHEYVAIQKVKVKSSLGIQSYASQEVKTQVTRDLNEECKSAAMNSPIYELI